MMRALKPRELMRTIICVIFSLILVASIPPQHICADEITLKDGSTVNYQSVFNMDGEGITLLIEDGITHIKWEKLTEKDANILSQGKHKNLIHQYRQHLEEQKKHRIKLHEEKLNQEQAPETQLQKQDAPLKKEETFPSEEAPQEEEDWKPSRYRYM